MNGGRGMSFAGQFGLTSDEFAFLGTIFAAMIVVIVPLYVSAWLNGRRTKTVKHEVSHNGGLDSANPTVKELAAGAYSEAFQARVIAEQARASVTDNASRFDRLNETTETHLHESLQTWRDVRERLVDLEVAREAAHEEAIEMWKTIRTVAEAAPPATPPATHGDVPL